MDYRKPLGLLAAFVVAVVTIGAVANIGLLTLAGGRVVAAGVVLGLTGLAVLAAAVAGSKSPEWLSNPYW